MRESDNERVGSFYYHVNLQSLVDTLEGMMGNSGLRPHSYCPCILHVYCRLRLTYSLCLPLLSLSTPVSIATSHILSLSGLIPYPSLNIIVWDLYNQINRWN